MIRRPPRSTLFPYTRSSDLTGNFIRRLPWFGVGVALATDDTVELGVVYAPIADELFAAARGQGATVKDRKSTRLNSSHTVISYAVFCLKKKKKQNKQHITRE